MESNIVRVAKSKDNPFVMVDRAIANDSSLSYAARGMMLYLLSKPDNWTVRMGDLANSSDAEGMHAIRSIFKELEASGHVTREKTREPNGRWAWETTVHERPTICDQAVHGRTIDGQAAYIISTDSTKNDANASATPPLGEKKPRTPQQRERAAQKKALRQYFESKTGLKIPTKGKKQGIARLWWNPAHEICELAGWDLSAAKKLVDAALAKLENMTVSNPNSILKTARAIAAKRGRPRASPGVTIAPGVMKLPVG